MNFRTTKLAEKDMPDVAICSGWKAKEKQFFFYTILFFRDNA
jgi:hypothetical protein